jgi:hypothetical protein
MKLPSQAGASSLACAKAQIFRWVPGEKHFLENIYGTGNQHEKYFRAVFYAARFSMIEVTLHYRHCPFKGGFQ